jgi:hypothetical protein
MSTPTASDDILVVCCVVYKHLDRHALDPDDCPEEAVLVLNDI